MSKKERTAEMPGEANEIVETVKDRYGKIAAGAESGCAGITPCCGTAVEIDVAKTVGYSDNDLGELPEDANLGLGCGAPVEQLALKGGETVLDLGSGAGIDVFLAARRVGPGGKVIGVDMTPEMVEKARANAGKAGMKNVDFREGRLESLPVEDASVDAVTSNCVINLVPDKAAVFREVARVLKPGGRMVISDIVLDGELPEAVTSNVLAYVGCVAGAMQRPDYYRAMEQAGLGQVEVLKDVDYVEKVGLVLPEETHKAAGLAGIDLEEIRGTVRSLTIRAVKP